MAIGSLLSRLVTKMATTTNKAPVSPIQPQRQQQQQECSVKFKSPGLVEKDKEKIWKRDVIMLFQILARAFLMVLLMKPPDPPSFHVMDTANVDTVLLRF
ncbi:hypothetical protein OIU74_024750 [Salix koriyanagi]|uniref:Uncharacterized protein n=1 Tax=Salix koriyanagi TaxID=2511006 RepID=A0A9Q0W840_9ROSI|nr:hypothetical protein OIU74_024750 [Salix koriyanagi]